MTMEGNGAAANKKIPHVLSVAGSDSGAGAGIQADLKACAARGVYCSTVITAVTAQNTAGVQGVDIVRNDFVAEQLKSVLSDMQVDVVKTGMLPSIGIVKILHQNLREFPVRALVVDPVMVSTSGDVLAGPSIVSCFREELLPMANIVTPNIKEASALLGGMPLETLADMRSAAKLLHALGPQNVLVKGGDLPDSLDAVDIFFDGEDYHELRSSRIKTRNTHGTGCTLASCIAAELAKGSPMLSAVKVAKCYIETALEYSKDIFIGNGRQGPFDHLLRLKSSVQNSGRQGTFNPNNLFLYAVPDSRMNKMWGRPMVDATREAIEGGATIVQLREKNTETRDFINTAKACLEICRSHGVPLLINDRVDVALACDADGVHVGQSDIPARTARILLGPDKIIGVSCKTPEQAQQAWIDGADYIGCGGVYPTTTKANNSTVGFDGLKAVCLASKLPVVAIGGINATNAVSVMESGVANLKGVAVVSALFDKESVLDATRNLHAILTEAASRTNETYM
ncbi:thiamine biosynthetic bifunctional enzyme TH1, chloroplastic isoform X2 [Ricinus communis]|nr:thiamine biosynthetic bifunctional enzyme TH1, chloroplastic isoform X2 [Ricinus communis]XP_025015161.1 thiamine biosynthetic bifunctional enzyme TH1, chloroplastic isoform X2 [Ricinus communis]|eukprot:XP_015581786.1 thiamine biosynthetic bifunctional enzyme TH1, chloroplastic isoform X2 [Ricinus communis]